MRVAVEILVALLVAISGLILVSPALAATDTPAPISWSVQPGNDAGAPTGKKWIKLDLQPGESSQQHMTDQSLNIIGRSTTPRCDVITHFAYRLATRTLRWC